MRAFPIANRRLAGWLMALIGIMVFLCALAAAAGIALVGGARDLSASMAGRATVQIVVADAEGRAARTRAVADAIRAAAPTASIRIVPDAEVAALVAPWLGPLAADVPLPRLVDVAADQATLPAIAAAVARAAPDVRVDGHARWLAPVERLVSAFAVLAAGLVLLLASAMAATVVMAARAALDTDRDTVALLHALGASDGQIASMFQRRFAADALMGSVAGLAAALLLLVPLGRLVAQAGPDLPGGGGAPAIIPWLVPIPLAAAAVAMAAARATVLATLGRQP